jgi:hypothetical protein
VAASCRWNSATVARSHEAQEIDKLMRENFLARLHRCHWSVPEPQQLAADVWLHLAGIVELGN